MILAAWVCDKCEVKGRDPEPVCCWNCKGGVKITARVTVKEVK